MTYLHISQCICVCILNGKKTFIAVSKYEIINKRSIIECLLQWIMSLLSDFSQNIQTKIHFIASLVASLHLIYLYILVYIYNIMSHKFGEGAELLERPTTQISTLAVCTLTSNPTRR